MRDVGGDNCQVFRLRCTDDMNRATTVPRTQEQAAVAAHVFRIVLDQLAGGDCYLDLGGRDHPGGADHLAHRVREEEDLFAAAARTWSRTLASIALNRSSGSMHEIWIKLHAEVARGGTRRP